MPDMITLTIGNKTYDIRDSKIGDLADLDTTAKSSLVSAINEVFAGRAPTDQQVQEAVDAWLEAHPEATTTVEDGSITKAKLVAALSSEITQNTEDVADLKSALQTFAVGGEKTVTAATADDGKAWGYHQFDLYLLEGMILTVTNNNSNYAIIQAVPTSGETFSLMRSNGNTTNSVTITKKIKAIRIYSDVYPINLAFSTNGVAPEQNEKIKAVSFNGTFTASDVENNRGYIDRYGRFYTAQIWFSTDYVAIPILTKDTDLTIKSTIYTNAGVAFYNSNKECILGIDGNNAADYGFESRYEIISRTITAPKGTAFVRICFYSWEQNAALAENLLISGHFGINTVVNAATETDARSEINERFDLCRWHDGTVYVTKNGVPQGSGLVIPNAANGRLYDRALLFEDDFNGTTLDTETWEYEIGYKRNNEPQVYQAENVSVSNSNLVITATREDVQAMKDGVLTDFEWTSGSIKCTMPYTYGRVEAKILFPSTVGSFGAFWGVGTVGEYPACGEIDVIESNPGTNNPNDISCGAFGVDANNTQKSYGRRYLKSYDQRGYHVYAVEITESEMQFSIDGELVSSVDTTQEYMSEFRTPYKWLLNLALSPASFGQQHQIPADVNEYKMYVDWFRFYAPKS